MADQREEDLELAPGEAGVGFKAEMLATNLLLGYWKHIVALLVIGLVAVLFYGQYHSFVQRGQRDLSARIADAERTLPANIIELPQLMAQPEASEVAVTPEILVAAAEKIEAVAREGSGPAAVEGLLKAAELYRLAGSPDKQRGALEAAAEEADGVLKYAAVGALANLDLEQDRGDDAVARLTKLMDTNDGYLAEQAALDLGMALEHLERPAEAQQVYGTFLEKWPASTRAEDIRSRSERLGGEG